MDVFLDATKKYVELSLNNDDEKYKYWNIYIKEVRAMSEEELALALKEIGNKLLSKPSNESKIYSLIYNELYRMFHEKRRKNTKH